MKSPCTKARSSDAEKHAEPGAQASNAVVECADVAESPEVPTAIGSGKLRVGDVDLDVHSVRMPDGSVRAIVDAQQLAEFFGFESPEEFERETALVRSAMERR